MSDLFAFSLRRKPPAPTTPIGPLRCAGDCPLHFSTIDGCSGVRNRLRAYGDFLIKFRWRSSIAHGDLKLRTFVFLNADRRHAIHAAQRIHAERAIAGCGEAPTDGAKSVSLRLKLTYLLAIHVEQLHLARLIHHGVVIVFTTIIVALQCLKADGLAGAIDGAIREKISPRLRNIGFLKTMIPTVAAG